MSDLGGFLQGVTAPEADPWPGWHPWRDDGEWLVVRVTLLDGRECCPEPNSFGPMGYGEALRRSLEMNRPWVERSAKRHGVEISAGLLSPDEMVALEKPPKLKTFAPPAQQPKQPAPTTEHPNVTLG